MRMPAFHYSMLGSNRAAMKILRKLLLLGVFHLDIWETIAFVVQTPRPLTPTRRRSRQLLPANYPHYPAFSYVGYQNDVVSSSASTFSENTAYANRPKSLTPITINGGSLKTFSLTTPAIERVLLLLQTTGHPLNANIELWQGPDNSPQKIGIYSEEGTLFGTVIQTPRHHNAIAIRNTCQFMQFPLDACMQVDMEDAYGNSSANLDAVTQRLEDISIPENFYGGGRVKEYSFAASVSSVQVLLETDGRPMNARIEVVQGGRPNNTKNVKTVIEVFVEDGLERPFFAALETPWATSTIVRVINAAPSDFLLSARVEPYVVDANAVVEPSWISSSTNTPPIVRQTLSKLKSLLRMIALLMIGFESATHMTEIEALVLSPQAVVIYSQLEEILSTVWTVLSILWNKSAEVIWTVLSILWNQLASLLS